MRICKSQWKRALKTILPLEEELAQYDSEMIFIDKGARKFTKSGIIFNFIKKSQRILFLKTSME